MFSNYKLYTGARPQNSRYGTWREGHELLLRAQVQDKSIRQMDRSFCDKSLTVEERELWRIPVVFCYT